MFSIGFTEFVIISLLAVIFIKPSDLPKLFRAIGKWIRKVRKFINEIKVNIIDSEIFEKEKEI